MPEEPTARVEHGQTRDGVAQFRRHWTADDARGALLLVHGIGEHSGRYEHVGAELAANGIDVLAHDQRGFGRSGGRRGHVDSFDELVDDVEDLLDERRRLGVPLVLMGHSLGGLVAATYLVSNRPQPDLAVLSAPALAANLPRWQRAIAPLAGTIAPRLSIPGDFDASVLSRDIAVQTEYEEDPLRVPGATTRLGREFLRAMSSTSAALDRLRVPTYVLHGTDDVLVPATASAPLGALPGVTRRLWPGLRHEPLNEPERDEVIAEIVDWILANLPSR